MNNQDLPLIPPWDLNNIVSKNQSTPDSTRMLKSHSDTVSYTKDLHEEWYQGRGVYGGVIAALLMNATHSLADDWTPRTLTVHFCAPAKAGTCQVHASVIQSGKKVKHVQGTIIGKEGVIATALATFARSRECHYTYPATKAPTAPVPEDVLELPINAPMMPSFCQFLSYRFCLHGIPYSGSDIPALGGWSDFRSEYQQDHAYFCALLDAWAPAVFSSLTEFTVAATVNLTYHFLQSDLSQLQGPFLFSGEVTSMSEGYAEEQDFLWDRHGVPIATARQLVALGK